jgi:LDH2 family malate/lactate/ureidoglycolate dehydrogenase
MYERGEPMPAGWAIDATGNGTTNAASLFETPKGALLPLGSDLAGHKGYGLGLMIEALTGGLAGYGRMDNETGWGATVQVQVWHPDAFGGLTAFVRETDALRAACNASTPRPGFDFVRVPGERGLAMKRRAGAEGVLLHETIIPKLKALSAQLNIPFE